MEGVHAASCWRRGEVEEEMVQKVGNGVGLKKQGLAPVACVAGGQLQTPWARPYIEIDSVLSRIVK
uniref:Uncharacterized protein n=1 Tax=Leersia perrieri TaxID=77586 RepID=A0A0D9WI60_9ORYZ